METNTVVPTQWFHLCELYLARISIIDTYVELVDNLPNRTKQEHTAKMVAFNGFMDALDKKKNTEDELDKLWNLD